MKELWDRIEAWFRVNVPADYYAFHEGATERQIRDTEEKLQIQLPDDVRSSYLVHNGSDEKAIFGYHDLASLDEMAGQWSMMSSALEAGCFEGYSLIPNGPTKAVWWDTLWIPVAIAGSQDSICVDLDPEAGGRVGQIIDTNHETGPERVLASDFREWLRQFADSLEAGDFEFDEKLEMIRRGGEE